MGAVMRCGLAGMVALALAGFAPAADLPARDAVRDPARCTAIGGPLAIAMPFLLSFERWPDAATARRLIDTADHLLTPLQAFDTAQLLLDLRPATLAATRRACALFLQAIEGGVADGYVPLGQLIEATADTPQNRGWARLAWQRAAGQGQAYAKLWLAVLDGRSAGDDKAARAAAATALVELAQTGFPPASLWAGFAALEGWDGAPDGTEARGRFEVAARAGVGDAAAALGRLHSEGAPGVEPDLALAERWFGECAGRGDLQCAVEAGRAAGSPRQPARDLARALRWFEQARAGGDATGTAEIARLLAFHPEAARRDRARACTLAREAAAANNGSGLFVLGMLMADGVGCARDFDGAVATLRRAIDAGDIEAMMVFGEWQVRGDRIARDRAAGLKLIDRAADSGQAAAICLRGRIEFVDDYTMAAARRAEPWLIDSVRRGWPGCLAALGDAIARGWLQDFPDPLAGVNLLARAADGGDAGAQSVLADMYREPRVVGRDLVRARTLYQSAAAADNAWAIWQLGLMHQYGQGGLVADPAAARAAFTRAMALGHGPAAASLGVLAQEGIGGPIDLAAARQMYARAGAMGAPAGWILLARMLADGVGGAADPPGALALRQKAFDAGERTDAFALANAYRLGMGIAADPARGLAVLKRAAEEGDARSANELGTWFQHGYGVARDLVEAERWYRRAAPESTALANLGYLASNPGPNADLVRALAFFEASLRGPPGVASPEVGDGARERIRRIRPLLTPGEISRAEAMAGEMLAGTLP